MLRHFLSRSSLLAIFIFLTGCELSPVVTPPPAADPDPVIVTGQADTLIKQANALFQQGNKRDAAETYFRAGMASTSPQRERLVLQAAEVAYMLPDKELMSRYLSNVNIGSLNQENSARHDYTKGLLLLLEERPRIAFDILPANTNGLPNGLANKINITRLKAAEKTGDPLLITKVRSSQHERLKTTRNQQSNSNEIWKQVQKLTVGTLNRERRTTNQILRGWLDLAYIQKTSGNELEQLKNNLDLWKQNFPSHPGIPFANKLMGNTPTPAASPDKVSLNTEQPTAILLPLSGRMNNVGQSIYQGILDAHKKNSGAAKLIQYDTAQSDATVLYNQAVKEGAGFVLGPFAKDNLSSMARNGYLNIPALALNYLPSNQRGPNNLIQLGLLPEDEAVQVAQLFNNKGIKNAVILAPDSQWGKRLEDAFANHFISNGGNIVDRFRFANRTTGYASSVSPFMNGLPSTVEAIFLAASPTQARLIYPLTQTKEENNIPVYATSHIFSGRTFPTMDNNLNGIRYTEIPWVLSQTSNISDNIRYPRLYALGLDAFSVSRNLSRLQSGEALTGNTGKLRFSSDGTIHRTLTLATFENGRPVQLNSG